MEDKTLSRKIEQLVNIILALERKPRDFGDAKALTATQIHSIQAIGDNNGMSRAELSHHLDLSPSTITQVIKTLVGKKCIKAVICQSDKRKSELHLTETGWQAYHQHEEWHKKLMELFESHFNLKELTVLGTFLDDVVMIFRHEVRKENDE